MENIACGARKENTENKENKEYKEYKLRE